MSDRELMTTHIDMAVLADEIADNPGFHGLEVYVQNPCCDRQVRVWIHERYLDTNYTFEDAVLRLKATARAIQILNRRLTHEGIVTTRDYPCDGCVRQGNVDANWLKAEGETMESLLAAANDV